MAPSPLTGSPLAYDDEYVVDHDGHGGPGHSNNQAASSQGLLPTVGMAVDVAVTPLPVIVTLLA